MRISDWSSDVCSSDLDCRRQDVDVKPPGMGSRRVPTWAWPVRGAPHASVEARLSLRAQGALLRGWSQVDGLFAPGFDAAVAAAQAQAQPVAPGREGTGVDVGAEADLRMLRIGGNFPERCDVRHNDAVVGACEDPTVESDFDGQLGRASCRGRGCQYV